MHVDHSNKNYNSGDNVSNNGKLDGGKNVVTDKSDSTSQNSDLHVFKEINMNETNGRSKSQTQGGTAGPQVPGLDLSRVLPNFSKNQQEQ